MKPHRVLVTAVGGNVGQGTVKALKAAATPFRVTGIDMESLSAGFSLVDRHYRVPCTGAPGFLDAMIDIVRKERIEAIYVCSPSELAFFSQMQPRFEAELGVTVVVNPPEVVAIGSDKLKTAHFLRNAGLPYLETVLAADREELAELVSHNGFPLIVKPRAGCASKGVFQVHSHREIEAASVLVPDLVVQRFVPETEGEFTVATLSGRDRRVRAAIILRRHLTQGTTCRTELIEQPALTDQIVRIVERLGAVGVCNLQFRLEGGTAFVFEINPRLSGTTGIRHFYGYNDAEMAFDLLHLRREVKQPALRRAVVLRYWNEIVLPGATFDTLAKPNARHAGYESNLSLVKDKVA